MSKCFQILKIYDSFTIVIMDIVFAVNVTVPEFGLKGVSYGCWWSVYIHAQKLSRLVVFFRVLVSMILIKT